MGRTLNVYDAFRRDRVQLKQHLLIPYEDLVHSPARAISKVADFLGLTLFESAVVVEPQQDVSYRKQWNGFLVADCDSLSAVDFPQWCLDYGYEAGCFE